MVKRTRQGGMVTTTKEENGGGGGGARELNKTKQNKKQKNAWKEEAPDDLP